MVSQAGADLIGAREVAGFFGGDALGDQGVDVVVGKAALFSRRVQHVEDGIEVAQELERRDGVASQELASVHGAVGVADKFENGGQGFGGFQIVVESFVERAMGSLRASF